MNNEEEKLELEEIKISTLKYLRHGMDDTEEKEFLERINKNSVLKKAFKEIEASRREIAQSQQRAFQDNLQFRRKGEKKSGMSGCLMIPFFLLTGIGLAGGLGWYFFC